MKIISKDNYNRETRNDTLVCETVTEHLGKEIVSFLNSRYSGNSSPDYFELVPDDYKLYVFEP